jgi:predicted nucleotidyltransferase
MIVINSTILNIVFEKMLNEKDIKLYVIDTDTFDYEHLYNNLDI